MIENTQKIHKCSIAEISKVRLRRSLGTLAVLIEQGNENLWPIFEKLEVALIRIEQNERRLSLYSTRECN